MSDTPRTDEIAKREFVPDGLWIKHARELEAELATERAHTKRLVNAGELVLGWFAIGAPDVSYVKQDLRAAIDAAMKEDAK